MYVYKDQESYVLNTSQWTDYQNNICHIND